MGLGTQFQQAQSEEQRLQRGTKVRTTQPNMDMIEEWDPEALKRRKWGVTGTVIAEHDAHGLYYVVRHEDGSFGGYDPSELEVTNQ